jgi:hypothetical protein
LERCKLSLALLHARKLKKAVLRSAVLVGALLAHAMPDSAGLLGPDLTRAVQFEMSFRRADLRDTDLSGNFFMSVDFRAAIMTRANLRGRADNDAFAKSTPGAKSREDIKYPPQLDRRPRATLKKSGSSQSNGRHWRRASDHVLRSQDPQERRVREIPLFFQRTLA